MTDLELFFLAVGIMDVAGVLIGMTILFVKAPTRIAREVKTVVAPLLKTQQEINSTLKQIYTQNALILDRSDR